MERMIIEWNIRRFIGLLECQQTPSTRKTILSLLAAERAKLVAESRSRIGGLVQDVNPTLESKP